MKREYIIYGILTILLLISIGFTMHYYKVATETKTESVVTYVTQVEHVRDTIPVVKYEKQLAVVKDTFKVVKTIHDTIENKEVAVVEVPINQKVYSDDSTYTAYVSGYKQNLDSIDIIKKTVYIDRNVTITKVDAKRFSIGPVIYAGYDFRSKQFGYGIGIGLSYRIWGF